MKSKALLALGLMLATSLSAQARAAVYAFDFTGSGIMGSISLTYAPNPNTGVLPGTSPNPVDPIGSYIVTGISGTFADTSLGIADTAITGIVPSDPSSPSPTNLLAPHSFGHYPILNGVPTPEGLSPGLSYDNLFYPGGSPQVATDYPFHGGFLDIYGIVFTLADGNAVNLWSNGRLGGHVSFGAAVTDGVDLLDYVGGISVAAVPEPATWALMIGGFGAVGVTMRRRTRAVAA